jgi:Tfp pilus assembly protein PilV
MLIPIPQVSHAVLASSPVTTVLSIVGGLIAVLITAAGIIGTWAALRVGRNTQITANYRATAESWESLATSLTAEKSELENKLEEAMVTITSLNTKVSTLQELATGHPAVERLSRDMNKSFQTLTIQMSRIEDSLRGAANDGPNGQSGGRRSTSADPH